MASAAPPPTELSAFPDWFGSGSVHTAFGPGGLSRALTTILNESALSEPNGTLQVAFVIDASGDQPIQDALALALARYRVEKTPSVARPKRVALLVGSKHAGQWTARVVAPFTEDLFAVGLESLRSYETSTEFDQGGVGAVWAALRLATELRWKPGSRPRLILLADDRRFCEREDPAGISGCPAPDPAVRIPSWSNRPPETGNAVPERIRAWARAQRATLHVVRCQLESEDGNAEKDMVSPSMHTGTRFWWTAGLFRQGTAVSPTTEAELIDAIERALDSPVASSSAEVDALLIVHERGVMNEEIPRLKKASPVFEKFLSSKGRRLGLVRWGRTAKSFSTASQLTDDPRKFAVALRSLRMGPAGDYPSDVWSALAFARSLGFRPSAKKIVILLDSAGASRGLDGEVVDWAERESIAVTFISP